MKACIPQAYNHVGVLRLHWSFVFYACLKFFMASTPFQAVE